jgi:membrane-associated phospholipid phosphatase
MGNGLFVIAGVVFLLFRKKFVWSLQVGVSFLISGLLVQLFKHLVHSPRPKVFFGSNAIHCVYGITCTGFNSFPSGHTTTIFAFTTLLSFYFPDRRSGLFFFGIAVLTGFSRIYLSDHFPIDVLAGSLFGVLISMIIYLLIPLKIVERKVPEPGIDSQSINLQ